MSEAIAEIPGVPAHVPPELVRNFSFATAPGANEDPHRAAAFLFQGPDIFFSPIVHDGNPAWVVTRLELIREVYQHPELFSSDEVSRLAEGLGDHWRLIPVHLDPPEHTKYRTLVNPIFSPARMAALEGGVRETCVELVEGFRHKGECEFIEAFGRSFPVTIFLRLMGLPLERTADFVAWEEGLLHAKSVEDTLAAARATRDYLTGVMNDRRAHPRDDLSSLLANGQVDGRPFTDDEVMGFYFMFFLAGLDTVTSALGFVFRELAQSPWLQQQLRDDPGLISNAIEELLRAYTIVESKRQLTRDLEFHGVKMKKGDFVFLATPIAGRDEREFPDPHHIDFTRENVRHLAFASGPHRCIGSHLARREMKIALEEWLTRIPPFRVKPGETPRTQATIVWGVTYLPLVWTPEPTH
ncbi:MAG: Cytochrome [Phenylobacterium sp.]|nr:Cytochrome [Phenylobacterium sp.]